MDNGGSLMTKLTSGFQTIEFAESRGLRLSKYADPIEGYRTGLTPDEAREIAKQDPSLIYLEGCPAMNAHSENHGAHRGRPHGEQDEIIDGTYAGSHHGSTNDAAIACIIDTLTASGTIDAEGAIDIIVQDGAEEIIRELAEQRDFSGEQIAAIADAWSDAYDKLLEMC